MRALPLLLLSTLAAAAEPTTLSLSIPNAPVWVTAPLTVTARLGTPDGGLATGTVTFSEDGGALGTSPVGGNLALLNTNQLALGEHRLGASYSGDATFDPSTSPELVFEVTKAPTTVTADVFNERLAIEVTSPLGVVDGMVSVVIDGAAPLTATLDLAGRARLGAPTMAGDHVIQVSYGGGPRFLPGAFELRYTLVLDGPDAGAPVDETPDAGVMEPMKPTGCGCAALEPGAAVLSLAVWLARRRERVRAP